MKKIRLFSTLLFVVLFLLLVWMMIGVSGGSFAAVLDIPTIAGLLIPVLVLLFSGYVKDFGNAVKITLGADSFDEKSLKRAEKSCSVLSMALWLESALFTLVGFLGVFNNLDNKDSLGPGIAVAVLPIFYALVLSILIFGIKACVERKM